MSLFVTTLILTVGIIFFVAIPFMFGNIKNYSIYLFLFGTGAMLSLCFFDLLPDVYESGGLFSIYIIIFVSLAYALLHYFHVHHHEHDFHIHPQALALFLGSLIAHNFASGMLLTMSYELSEKMASTIFMTFVAHKGYEALMLGSILVEQRCFRFKKFTLLACYVAALPLGVFLTYLFQDKFNEHIALIISSIAVGTLIGCLIFDFLLPSLRQLKNKHMHILWLIAGFFITQFIDFYNS